jgi:transketolase
MTKRAARDVSDYELAHLQERATLVRQRILEGSAAMGSGHLGPTMSCVEIIVALYYNYLRIDPAAPQWPERDRFILSKGHACAALYAVLADLGFFPPSELDDFAQLGSRFADHPNMKANPGVDFSSGSLGHGLAVAAGMAEAIRLRRGNSRIVAMLGDGELNEGQVWEAAAYCAARGLANVLVVVDQNGVQVDGRTDEILDFGSVEEKWQAFGWAVASADGHDLRALRAEFAAFDARRSSGDRRPSVVVARTVAGKGISFIEGMAEWHVGYLAGADFERALSDVRAMYPAVES